jgi:LmbE family N-acetylglucosaminyl deacetylase
MEKINFKNKIIMAIGAHPDDNDFGCSATMALAAKQGAKVIYVVATTGQRGSRSHHISAEKLSATRVKEQNAAAKILGVKQVRFLDYRDGELEPTLKLKEEIVMLLRQYRPDYVFTMDPSRFYYVRQEHGFINHSDHRAIGEATLDACYPLARDLNSFPLHQKMGLKPHKVKEIFLSSFMSDKANCFVDVTKTFGLKLKALAAHKSQFDDFRGVKSWMTHGSAELGKHAGYKYAEAFIRLRLR